jgi:curved DNA-binding protein CbpA
MEEVKDAFRKLALQFHPDRGGSIENMKQLNAEYKYIKDEQPSLPVTPAAQVTGKRDFTDYRAKQRAATEEERMAETMRRAEAIFNQAREEARQRRAAERQYERSRSKPTPDPSLINLDVFIMVLNKFKYTQQEAGYKKNWVWYQLKSYVKKNNRKIGIPHLNNVAIQMGFGPEWILYRMEELIEENLFAN